MDRMMAEADEARARRRKLHKRNRIIAWISFVGMIAFLCVGGFFLIKSLGGSLKLPKADLRAMFAGSAPTQQTSVSETSVSAEPEKPDIVEDLTNNEQDIVVEPSEPETHEPTEQELFDAAVEAYIQAMPVDDRIAGLFIVSPEQITGVQAAVLAGDGTKKALDTYAVGGILYSEKNMVDSEQFKTMLSKTAEMSRYPIFLAVDEETGHGVMAEKFKLTETVSQGETGKSADPQKAYTEESRLAVYLKEYGINLNFGLSADVLTDPENTAAEDRTFGSDPSVVGQMTALSVRALRDNGITAALKFFPGEGGVTGDTSQGLVTTQRTLEEVKECEFKSFAAGIEAGADMLLVSHIFAPNVTNDAEQCSRSKNLLTDILRMEYGYDDLIIITDALNKAAISEYYDSAETVITSLKAGADMVMLPENFEDAYNGVSDAIKSCVVSIDRVNASLKRIYKVKLRGKTPAEVYAMAGITPPDVSGNNQ